MFSEIMSAFTEIAEKDSNELKNSEKRALFSIKYSRGAQSSTKQRTGKHQEKELLRSGLRIWCIYCSSGFFLHCATE